MNISALRIHRTKSPAARANTAAEPATLVSLANAAASAAANAAVGVATTVMSCESCGLSGGPFSPAEAAYLRAIHDRMFHGAIAAA